MSESDLAKGLEGEQGKKNGESIDKVAPREEEKRNPPAGTRRKRITFRLSDCQDPELFTCEEGEEEPATIESKLVSVDVSQLDISSSPSEKGHCGDSLLLGEDNGQKVTDALKVSTLRLSELIILQELPNKPRGVATVETPSVLEKEPVKGGEENMEEQTDGESKHEPRRTQQDLIEEKVVVPKEKASEVPMGDTTGVTSGQWDAETLYRLSHVFLSDLRTRIIQGIPIDIRPASEVMDRIIKENLDNDQVIHRIAKMSRDAEYYVSHAVNTAAYAIRVGRQLEYPINVLKELGMGAYLCDIGLFKIPEEILSKRGKLTAEELEIVRSHVNIAYELLKPMEKEFPLMVRAVYEHHERENGQGYPRGLAGDAISELAKIIGICDSYVAMTHNRPHQKALIQTDSIRELVEMKGKLFSAKIIKAFLDAVSIFPIGSYVVLNNKMVGEVVSTNRNNSFKPVIRLLYDEQGRRFEESRMVDLMKNPVLHIEGIVRPDDLPQDQ